MKLTIAITPMMRVQLLHAQNIEIEVPEAAELERQRDALLAALEEVVRISDRKHDAWDRAKEAIAEAKRGH